VSSSVLAERGAGEFRDANRGEPFDMQTRVDYIVVVAFMTALSGARKKAGDRRTPHRQKQRTICEVSMATATKRKVAETTPVPVRFGKEERRLLKILEARAAAESRSLSGQLKHYARLGLIACDNPDLPLSMIQGILESREELKQGLGEPYRWGVLEG
jgi:ParD-like antitoxin of type II bacterial toxin-antitoxin system